MALTTAEKVLLQYALCDGAFSPMGYDTQGRPAPSGPSPAVLTAVASMPDEQVRVTLRAYQANKAQNLTNRISHTNAKLAEVTSTLAIIQSVAVTPPPVAVPPPAPAATTNTAPAAAPGATTNTGA